MQKSMCSLPSTSQTRDPLARAATNGRPVPRCRRAAAVTPPGSTRLASSKYCSERVTSRVCCTMLTLTVLLGLVLRLPFMLLAPCRGYTGTQLPAFNSAAPRPDAYAQPPGVSRAHLTLSLVHYFG